MVAVLDASALAKLFLEEEHSVPLRGFVKEAVEEDRDLLAPELVAYDVGNIVTAQFPERSRDEQAGIIQDVLALLRRVSVEEPGRVLRFTDETDSFYDACYLWVARREQATLVTFDDVLASVAETHDVAVVQPGADN